MKRLGGTVTIVLAMTVATRALAEPSITWAKRFPVPGDKAGQIKGEGFIHPEDKQAAIMAVEVWAWPDGMAVTKYKARATRLADGSFSWRFVADGLDAGATYNVTVEAVLRIGGAPATIRTKPKISKAK